MSQCFRGFHDIPDAPRFLTSLSTGGGHLQPDGRLRCCAECACRDVGGGVQRRPRLQAESEPGACVSFVQTMCTGSSAIPVQ